MTAAPAARAAPIPVDRSLARQIIATAAGLLFANGQTTERIVAAAEGLGDVLGHPASLLPRWGEIALRVGSGPHAEFELIPAVPSGVDMGKVAAISGVIDRLCVGEIAPEQACPALADAERTPARSTVRFAVMAGAAATALGVIFGAAHALSLALIGLSAVLGALLRRGLARVSSNAFVQPFAAALLAGVIGGVAARLQLGSSQRLIALCPCMVRVPGPHLLNGAVDLARGRIPLGSARLAFAGLIVTAICAGLLGGLELIGVTLPPGGSSRTAPLVADVVAAGVAVAAYGTFYSMPWRMLPAPVAIGMLAHATRWLLTSVAGADAAAGAFAACLLAGMLASLAADRLRLPFAGMGFASVVSLIPGVLVFRMAGGLLQLAHSPASAPVDLPATVLADGAEAAMILLAMTLGLIVPRMLLEHLSTAERAKSRAQP